MKRLKVHVTQEDIDEGKASNCELCPIARAVKRTTGAERVFVGFGSVRVNGSAEYGSFLAPISRRAEWFIKRFDRWQQVEPATFVFTRLED